MLSSNVNECKPLIGGTYMTLLNTVSNLGFKWVETTIMFVIDAVGARHILLNPKP
jgi:hypothetical protein